MKAWAILALTLALYWTHANAGERDRLSIAIAPLGAALTQLEQAAVR